jgi:uncharacterized membrane protein
MASRASIGGHPIHPMLIPFPIGLLVFSFIADLIYLWRGTQSGEITLPSTRCWAASSARPPLRFRG